MWVYSPYIKRYAGDRRAAQVQEELSTRLLSLYRQNHKDGWNWFEDRLTYCNAALPHAMLLCGETIPNSDFSEVGIESLTWLAELQHSTSEGKHFVPIGTNGFYQKGGERAHFDQQPVEAQVMVSSCLDAYRITRDKKWLKEARTAFDWFLGRNDLHLPIYDPITGGCRDGLHSDRVNKNQGAESTLAFLHALLDLRLSEFISKSVE